jgi:F-type H+-transporting ATPase subunit b
MKCQHRVSNGVTHAYSACTKILKEPYKEWAETNIQKIKSVLDKSRSEHTQAVKERINSVEQMKDVVSLTQGLFALSKVRQSLSSWSW